MATESIQRLWHILSLVPEGKVASYGQIADLAGLPGRARLTSKALSSAPASLNLPWHRILRSSGQIAFAKGSDQAAKQIGLLQQENIVVLRHRVNLKECQWCPDLGFLMQLPY